MCHNAIVLCGGIDASDMEKVLSYANRNLAYYRKIL